MAQGDERGSLLQKRRRGRPRGIRWRDIGRLAEQGNTLADIIDSQDLPDAAVEANRKRLVDVVRIGNAKHRVAVNARLVREGVGKGKAHSLLALGRNRLGFDKLPEDKLSKPDDTDARAHLMELIQAWIKQHPKPEPKPRRPRKARGE